ncbi:MAG: hypothetical protein ACI4E3_00695 [Candidatus Fimousia sp.]
MNHKITFSTFPSLQTSFKKVCEIQCISMTEQLELLTTKYLNAEIGTLETLRSSLIAVKNLTSNEIKSYKMTFQIDTELYKQLKETLASSRTRPASFFTFLMAYAISAVPAEALHRNEALSFFKVCSPDIIHIVYGLKYYKPENDTTKLVHSEYFYEPCTEERFQNFYQKLDRENILIDVLAVHRP